MTKINNAADEIERQAKEIEALKNEAIKNVMKHLENNTIVRLEEELERLREALLTASTMLSEMGMASEDKCQAAYDFLCAAIAQGSADAWHLLPDEQTICIY